MSFRQCDRYIDVITSSSCLWMDQAPLHSGLQLLLSRSDIRYHGWWWRTQSGNHPGSMNYLAFYINVIWNWWCITFRLTEFFPEVFQLECLWHALICQNSWQIPVRYSPWLMLWTCNLCLMSEDGWHLQEWKVCEGLRSFLLVETSTLGMNWPQQQRIFLLYVRPRRQASEQCS